MTQPAITDRDSFLMEYTDEASVAKYVSDTAGKGIQFILEHVYGPLYSDIIDSIYRDGGGATGFRVLEYGCGGGMNLLHIFRLLLSKDIPVLAAVGTDFSQPLLDAAEREKEMLIDPENRDKIAFLRASNETLLDDLRKGMSQSAESLPGSFELVVGVNTFRYAIRLEKQQSCADDIAALLAPGGYSIMIDMNNKFPCFKSRFRGNNSKPKTQTRLPSLQEYAAPFRLANLDIVQARHFCWIPHSAGASVLMVAKTLAPVLNLIAPGFAMRSLVIARKRKEAT